MTSSNVVPHQSIMTNGVPSVLLNVQAVTHNVAAYLYSTLDKGKTDVLAPGGNHPTPEGLALALGLSCFRELQQIFKDEKRLNAIPEAAVREVVRGIALLQDYYLKHSLSSTINVQMVKFLSNAYFDIRETSSAVSESHNISSSENTITIKVETHKAASMDELKEMNRLESALKEQVSIELAALGHELDVEVEDLI